jgi:hypothetical protein
MSYPVGQKPVTVTIYDDRVEIERPQTDVEGHEVFYDSHSPLKCTTIRGGSSSVIDARTKHGPDNKNRLIQALDQEIVDKQARLKELNAQIDQFPQFHHGKLSELSEERLRNYVSRFGHLSDYQHDPHGTLLFTALDIKGMVEYIDGLRQYCAFLEREHGHVDTNEDLRAKLVAIEEVLMEFWHAVTLKIIPDSNWVDMTLRKELWEQFVAVSKRLFPEAMPKYKWFENTGWGNFPEVSTPSVERSPVKVIEVSSEDNGA